MQSFRVSEKRQKFSLSCFHRCWSLLPVEARPDKMLSDGKLFNFTDKVKYVLRRPLQFKQFNVTEQNRIQLWTEKLPLRPPKKMFSLTVICEFLFYFILSLGKGDWNERCHFLQVSLILFRFVFVLIQCYFSPAVCLASLSCWLHLSLDHLSAGLLLLPPFHRCFIVFLYLLKNVYACECHFCLTPGRNGGGVGWGWGGGGGIGAGGT